MEDRNLALISSAREDALPNISKIQVQAESTGPSVTAKQDILIKDQQKIAYKRKSKPKNNILSKFLKL